MLSSPSMHHARPVDEPQREVLVGEIGPEDPLVEIGRGQLAGAFRAGFHEFGVGVVVVHLHGGRRRTLELVTHHRPVGDQAEGERQAGQIVAEFAVELLVAAGQPLVHGAQDVGGGELFFGRSLRAGRRERPLPTRTTSRRRTERIDGMMGLAMCPRPAVLQNDGHNALPIGGRHPASFPDPAWTPRFSTSSTSSGPARPSTGSWRRHRRSTSGGPSSRSLVGLTAWRGGRRARWMLVTLGLLLAVGETLVDNPLKHAVHRLRPWQAMAGVRQVDLARHVRPRLLALFQPVTVSVTGPSAGRRPAPRAFVSLHDFGAATVLTLFYRRRGWWYVPAGVGGGVFARVRRRALAERRVDLDGPGGRAGVGSDSRRAVGGALLPSSNGS